MATISIKRNALLSVVAGMVAVIGVSVACASYFGLALGAAKMRASKAEAMAADWKERASETYQRMLFANIPAGQSVIIPAGTLMDCEAEPSQVGDRLVMINKNCKFYPPRAN